MNNLLACPLCKRKLDSMSCLACDISFSRSNGVQSFISKKMYASEQDYENAMRIIDFWGNGWKKRLLEPDHKVVLDFDSKQLKQYADQLMNQARTEKSLIGVEVPTQWLPGKVALNIGCGAGTEALLLSNAGASCIAMDITAPAAEIAQELIMRLGGNGIGIQADARFIPLEDCSVDFVYSSGVLHHSPDISKSIDEIYRVLKPGGIACIMLYATWSITFMQEKLMRWTGEQAWETEGRKNPLTTTYSQKECFSLFSRFEQVSTRKHGASLGNIAKIGRYLPRCFDSYLDPYLGANINIKAIKR